MSPIAAMKDRVFQRALRTPPLLEDLNAYLGMQRVACRGAASCSRGALPDLYAALSVSRWESAHLHSLARARARMGRGTAGSSLP